MASGTSFRSSLCPSSPTFQLFLEPTRATNSMTKAKPNTSPHLALPPNFLTLHYPTNHSPMQRGSKPQQHHLLSPKLHSTFLLPLLLPSLPQALNAPSPD